MEPSAPQSALHRLARQYGIESSYVDVQGRTWEAPPDALTAVLVALGAPIAGPDDVEDALRERQRQRWQQPLEPVAVAWEGRGTLTLRVPASTMGAYTLRVVDEDGHARTSAGTLPADATRIDEAHVAGTDYAAYAIPLPEPLPHGYHDATVQCGSVQAQARVLAAPARAFTPTSDRKHWGVFAPLYALRGPDSRGAGHLGDLAALQRWVVARGGTVTATLPLLAAFLDEPFEPSPYAPASRLAWNELYLDLEALPEYGQTPGAWTALHRGQAHAVATELAAAPLVDYRRQYALLRPAIAAMATRCFETAGPRRDALQAFARARPLVDAYARFRAVGDRHRAAWPSWPTRLAGGAITDSDYDPDDYRTHLYAQWGMHEQLTALGEANGAGGLGLYLDLPVGVGGASFDTWRFGDAYVRGLSTGAPPDALFSGGQNWAFPPLHPERVRADGYHHLIEVLRNHLRYAGVLRIDHVMGLHRLYVIPEGGSARDGIYIKYRSEELYALLCIESHRAGTVLVGEDLGTVPDVVRDSMAERGVHGLHVLQYEARADPTAALPPAPAGSLATINTHDMPPFAAFWRGADLEQLHALGLLDDDAVAPGKAERATLRADLRTWLSRHTPLAPDADADEALLAAAQTLGRSPAAIVVMNLEDLWGELKPQNVPGTWREYPNWRRRAALGLAELSRDPRVDRVLTTLATARTGERVPDIGPVRHDVTRLGEQDLYLLGEGTHERLYAVLGAHPMTADGAAGVCFSVWAPSADYVSVVGDFNAWDRGGHPLAARAHSGVWEGFVPGAREGDLYKFHIAGPDGFAADKADPVGQRFERAPGTASIVATPEHAWTDHDWMERRALAHAHDAPIAIYEVHLGSWMRVPEERDRVLSYRELAPRLAQHVKRLGFTHVELLPVMEHPFYGSWGYQVTGYFAADARYGSPDDLMALIDHLHGEGIGVIVDWVPSHFPTDAHALAQFDGTHLYEHADPRQGFHPDWNSAIFNYGRKEVASFLISSALYWLEVFHADGLRVDGVASMLYRDYSRQDGEWIPNEYGGKENLEAIALLRRMNEAVYRRFPDVQTFAEESTAWPMVSRPTHVGGLGFGFKWDMGWMHDTLGYLALDPVHRKFHQHALTFRMIYAWGESFVLSLSHDEVVHGKGSLLSKMPGDDWQQRANLRLLFALQWLQPGKKLLFMGGEFGQRAEWNHDRSLDWHLCQLPEHAGVMQWVADLNATLREQPALHELDHEPEGFAWIDFSDTEHSVVSFVRKGRRGAWVVAVFNFTPVPRHDYRVGLPVGGGWHERLNGDAACYGGSGLGNAGHVTAQAHPMHGHAHSAALTLPPLAAVVLVSEATVEGS